MPKKVNTLRDLVIFKQRMSGEIYKKIGEEHDISIERVRQIYQSVGRRLRSYAMRNNMELIGNRADIRVDYFYNKVFWLSVLEQYELTVS